MAATIQNIVLPGKRLLDGDAINNLSNLTSLAKTYGITAHAGGGRTSATALSFGLNVIATVATDADSVILPAAVAGTALWVANAAASHAAQVFTQGSDTIDGTAGSTGVSMAAGASSWFCCAQDGVWFSQGIATGNGSFTTLTVSSTSSFGGAISTPQGAATSAGTAFAVTAGAGGATSGVGGAVTMIAGAGTNGNSAGGVASVTGGAGQGSAAGGVSKVVGGAGGATGAGGAAQVTGGAGGATSGTGGAVTIAGGAGTNGNATGGAVSATGGAGQGTGTGGASSVVGGASGAGATGNGGAVNITGGAAASTNGNGGSVVLTGGALAGSGFDGAVQVRSTLSIKQGTPTAKTTDATLTAAEIKAGIITVNQGAGGTSAQTLPLASAMDTGFPNFATDDAFDFSVINISTNAAEDASVVTNTGWTLVGNMDIASNAAATDKSAGSFRARKTGVATWTLYRLS